MRIKGYYFITDHTLSRKGIISDVKNALAAGACAVQYRFKSGDINTMVREAAVIRRLCKKALFLINDRIDLAVAVNADGVHLGQGDIGVSTARRLLGKNKIIGVTVHNVLEAKKALADGADYLGAGPIFSTTTKKDAGQAYGTALIKKIRRLTKKSIVAIGGITLSNALDVISSGADSLSAISSVVTENDVKEAALKFQRLFP